jgi:hypothetical protein
MYHAGGGTVPLKDVLDGFRSAAMSIMVTLFDVPIERLFRVTSQKILPKANNTYFETQKIVDNFEKNGLDGIFKHDDRYLLVYHGDDKKYGVVVIGSDEKKSFAIVTRFKAKYVNYEDIKRYLSRTGAEEYKESIPFNLTDIIDELKQIADR